MKIIGIIPARAGSKGIKNKNIINVNGKPLIYYTIQAIKKSKLKDYIVSSDSKKILNIAKKYGAKRLFLRPKKYSLDKTRSIELYRYLKKDLEKYYVFDAIMILQPTAPMRRSTDINDAINLFKKNRCDSVISICSVGGNHPARVKYLNKKKYIIDPIFSEKKEGQNRQELRDAYIKNGAIYLFKKKNLDKNTIKGKKSLSMIMPRKFSINIDEDYDLEIAKYLLKKIK
jgi:CMP-N-acetylneuraminic acid synthetase